MPTIRMLGSEKTIEYTSPLEKKMSKTRLQLLEELADVTNDAAFGLKNGVSADVAMKFVNEKLAALKAHAEAEEAAENTDLAARIEARKKRESDELDKFCLEMAGGYVHEHEIWAGDDLKSRERKIKFMGTWLRRCCNEAIEIGGSYSEGLEKGRDLQKDEDETLLKQVEVLREKLSVEGDQTLVEALDWKLEDENRVLREEVRAMGREKRKEGFELGVSEMRLRLENRLREAAEGLLLRGPDVT